MFMSNVFLSVFRYSNLMVLFIWLVSGPPCSNDGTSWKDASEGEQIILPLALHGYYIQ